jgi:hypothetical protein
LTDKLIYDYYFFGLLDAVKRNLVLTIFCMSRRRTDSFLNTRTLKKRKKGQVIFITSLVHCITGALFFLGRKEKKSISGVKALSRKD